MSSSDTEIAMCCDEVITPWAKSSYSNTGANCVETARSRSGAVTVRDSQAPEAGLLAFAPDRWETFTRRVKAGRFDAV